MYSDTSLYHPFSTLTNPSPTPFTPTPTPTLTPRHAHLTHNPTPLSLRPLFIPFRQNRFMHFGDSGILGMGWGIRHLFSLSLSCLALPCHALPRHLHPNTKKTLGVPNPPLFLSPPTHLSKILSPQPLLPPPTGYVKSTRGPLGILADWVFRALAWFGRWVFEA